MLSTPDKKYAGRVAVAKRFECIHKRSNGEAKPTVYEVVERAPGSYGVRSSQRTSLGTFRYTDENLDLAAMEGVASWRLSNSGVIEPHDYTLDEALKLAEADGKVNLIPCYDE